MYFAIKPLDYNIWILSVSKTIQPAIHQRPLHDWIHHSSSQLVWRTNA